MEQQRKTLWICCTDPSGTNCRNLRCLWRLRRFWNSFSTPPTWGDRRKLYRLRKHRCRRCRRGKQPHHRADRQPLGRKRSDRPRHRTGRKGNGRESAVLVSFLGGGLVALLGQWIAGPLLLFSKGHRSCRRAIFKAGCKRIKPSHTSEK